MPDELVHALYAGLKGIFRARGARVVPVLSSTRVPQEKIRWMALSG